MSVDDYGIEALKKAAREVTPGNKAEYEFRVNTVLAGGATEATLQDIENGVPESLGQKTMAESMPVTIASDQTPPLFVTKHEYLQNAGSKNMNVNGTLATPVDFTLTPGASLTFYVDSLMFFIRDAGTMDYTDFGILVALTNGLLFDVTTNGISHDLINLMNNTDIAISFSDYKFLAPAATTGFLNEADYFLGVMNFPNPITLKNSTSDFIRARVRDSLSAIDGMHCLVKYRRTP